MSAILWKEFRENLKWAALILLIVGAGMSYTVLRWTSYRFWRPIVIMATPSEDFSVFLLFTVFGSATGGLALGLLQTLSERHNDQWAFLVQRPVSRTSLFIGKALAGVCLYLLALGVPLAFSIGWVATPGHMASPFYVSMAYPGLSDVLCGLAYYFTALIIANREARWYGSRGLSLGLAILASILVVAVAYFWLALLVVFVAVVVAAIAAGGTFVSRGNESSHPIVSRMAVGAGLLTGILMVGTLCVLATMGMLPTRPTAYSRYELAKDGEIIRVATAGSRITSITDINGNPIRKYDLQRLNEGQSALDNVLMGTQWLYARTESRALYHTGNYRSSYSLLIPLHTYGATQWHYSLRDRLLLAYDIESKRRIGGVGPDGFFPADRWPKRRFGSNIVAVDEINDGMWLAFSDGVFWFDVYTRQIHRLITPSPREEVIAAATWYPPDYRRGERHLVVISGRPSTSALREPVATQLHVARMDGQVVLSVPLEHRSPQYRQWRVGIAPERTRYYVWYIPSDWRTNYVTELDNAGNVVSRHILPVLPRVRPPQLHWLGFGQPGNLRTLRLRGRCTRAGRHGDLRVSQTNELLSVMY